MSAKHSKKSARLSGPAPTPATPLAATPVAAPAAPSPAPAAATSWIDSSDPRRRTIGRIALVGVWLYVAALWLLALDQTFDWGLFGPKLPPAP